MRVCVVGGGSIGSRHLQNLDLLGIETRALVEPDSERREQLCSQTNIAGFSTLEQCLEWCPDVVIVASPSNIHIEQSLVAVCHGCHVFIEKPLSHTLDDVQTLIHEIDKRNLVSMVGCNMRFHPGPSMVKQLLEQRAIGKVLSARIQAGSYLPRWRPWQDYQQSYSASTTWGGALLDCIHEIDLALWYFGQAQVIGSVCIPASNIGLQTDGLAEMILAHDSGVLSSIHLNFVQRDYRRCCQIIGSEGTIYWDFTERKVTIYGEDGCVQQVLPEPEHWQVNHMYVDELKHFLHVVTCGGQTTNPVSGGYAALQIALAVRSKERI